MNEMKKTCLNRKMEKFSLICNICINGIVLEQRKCEGKHMRLWKYIFSRCSFFFWTIERHVDLLWKASVKFSKQFGSSKTFHEVEGILKQSTPFISHSQESNSKSFYIISLRIILKKIIRKSEFDWRWSKLIYSSFWYFLA